MDTIRQDAQKIIAQTIAAVRPDRAVQAALRAKTFARPPYLAAIGKAAYAMTAAALEVLGGEHAGGVLVTKYGHAGEKPLPGISVVEAGHPVLDENSLKGARQILDMTAGLTAEDTVLFLVSGGGSALFEAPEDGITLGDMEEVTRQLLACGADIVEINTLRKRLSAVKGGKFALHCHPARVFSIVLSDVIGDRLDAIASGPAYPDSSTAADAIRVAEKYGLSFPAHIMQKLYGETPKTLDNTDAVITGSVRVLCREAAGAARALGYEPLVLCSTLGCEAREGGRFMAAIARGILEDGSIKRPCAVIAGGETVVTLKGQGKGGRNQEFALAAADLLDGYPDTVLFSVGSDGTDGPTDAAGGIVDGTTRQALLDKGLRIPDVLANNDAYHALKQVDGLVMTGPTGTNVNDFAVLLCR